MKSFKEIRDELIREGAVVRLQELNKERDILTRILNRPSIKADGIIREAGKIRDTKIRVRKWTRAQKAKFKATMKKKYGKANDNP